MTTSMPRAVQERLINDGLMTEARITHHTQTRRCPTCGAWVLTALAAGFVTTVDPTPLNPEGELLAVVGGRATYRHAGRYLTRRFVLDIDMAPAGSSTTGDVVPSHVCGAPSLPGAPSVNIRPARIDLFGTPPF